jgi:Cys-rich protein (TIGR04453 family)
MNRTLKLSVVYVSTLFAALLVGSPLFANDCNTACTKYVNCVAEVTKKQPTPEQRSQLSQGCMKTCTKHKTETIACYKKAISSENSCTAYSACIQKNFSK